eukprot:scaffold256756_cov36-Prasinocladus_malaysianus.AAC.1
MATNNCICSSIRSNKICSIVGIRRSNETNANLSSNDTNRIDKNCLITKASLDLSVCCGFAPHPDSRGAPQVCSRRTGAGAGDDDDHSGGGAAGGVDAEAGPGVCGDSLRGQGAGPRDDAQAAAAQPPPLHVPYELPSRHRVHFTSPPPLLTLHAALNLTTCALHVYVPLLHYMSLYIAALCTLIISTSYFFRLHLMSDPVGLEIIDKQGPPYAPGSSTASAISDQEDSARFH